MYRWLVVIDLRLTWTSEESSDMEMVSGFNVRGCRGQVVNAAEQQYTAIVEGTSTSDVLLLLKTGLRYVPKWKTEG